jgi:hypothetical protein
MTILLKAHDVADNQSCTGEIAIVKNHGLKLASKKKKKARPYLKSTQHKKELAE